jgi:hypothetical protein
LAADFSVTWDIAFSFGHELSFCAAGIATDVRRPLASTSRIDAAQLSPGNLSLKRSIVNTSLMPALYRTLTVDRLASRPATMLKHSLQKTSMAPF